MSKDEPKKPRKPRKKPEAKKPKPEEKVAEQIDFMGVTNRSLYLQQFGRAFRLNGVRQGVPVIAEYEFKPTPSWVKDKCSPVAMLREIEQRYAYSRHLGSSYCACDTCQRERWSLIRDLRNVTCENR